MSAITDIKQSESTAINEVQDAASSESQQVVESQNEVEVEPQNKVNIDEVKTNNRRHEFAAMNGVQLDAFSQTLPRENNTNQVQRKELEEKTAEPEEIITTRQTWQQPWLKALVIGGGIFTVVAFIGGMVGTTISAINTSGAKKQQSTEIAKSPESAELDDNGRMKTDIALTSQKGELKNLNQQSPQPIPSSTTPVTVKAQPQAPTPQPRPQPVRYQPQPVRYQPQPPSQPRIVYRSIPAPQLTPQISQRVSQPPRLSAPIATPVTKPNVDPMQQWLAAANIGSYGSNSEIDDSPTSTPVADANKIQGGSGLVKVSNTSNPSSSTQYQNQNIDYSGKRVLVGTHVEGSLETPVAWGGSSGQINQNYLIRLTQPLKAFDGTEVLPTGSYIVAQINGNESGFVQMKAVSALINSNGTTAEKSLPENSVLILSKSGKLLQAKSKRGSDLGSILLTSVLSGVAKAAEIENRPTSQTSINSLSVSTVTTNDSKNLAAGFAEGSLNELVQRIQSENQQRLQQIQSEPKVFVIDSGTSVQIFVNQTISL